ncbi:MULTISPECIES: hypothetical protein [unclassified Brevundimonas]|jgi:hypothetical protein|uniref:hypothetical protein n=1 Tax=unclassified Brevundimonas TaxID=2622653 RepID=UPI000C495B87|nr:MULTISPECIES: hypothetical protein [unclassified Brevundimonas]MAL87539.1 hypothetical protein [Brevundimonas sp.]HAV49737.1 hypothetical protein [Brevundimonas sp.]|tara:strand:- start:25654 stop:26025 length:372 start_codon:yes stop_codon:yes gene_type:complete
MTDATDATPSEQIDGKPDVTSEIARIDKALASLEHDSQAFRSSFDYDGLIAELDTLIPEDQRKDAPANASAIDRVFHKMTAALAAAKRPVVPVTDTAKPSLETPAEDLSCLPPHVRIARGYAA